MSTSRLRLIAIALSALMLVSIVPFFSPWGNQQVFVAAAGYPTDLNVSLVTNYGDHALFQGFPYELDMNVTEVNSTGGTVNINSVVLVNITYIYKNGTEI